MTGNYKTAIAKFDRVIRPDGSVVIMRRISARSNPNAFAYLPSSWPAVGAMGKERVMDANGRLVVERDVMISQYDIMRAGIPMGGPPIATLAFERNIMPDGTTVVTASAENADPSVALAPAGNACSSLWHGVAGQVHHRRLAVAAARCTVQPMLKIKVGLSKEKSRGTPDDGGAIVEFTYRGKGAH